MGYGMMGGGSMMMLLWVILFGALIYFTVSQKYSNNNAKLPHFTSSGSEALEIAKSRFAKGEISVEEFEQIKKVLL